MTQHHHLKLAIISDNNKFIQPQAYFGVCGGILPELKVESGSLSAQIETWSKIEAHVKVTKIDPLANTLDISNGKQFTYKALVLAPGFEHKVSGIKGLDEMQHSHESENVFVHMLDNKERVLRNFWNGWNNAHGDMICYSPKAPYKGEGSDFYALYYEHFMRQDKMQYRASANARIQYWTPNKEIMKFGYANEVVLDECHKRGIDVMLGWEMLEVKYEGAQKVAVFRNVDSGETIEKDFNHANINPPSGTWDYLKDAGLCDSQGGLDVNKYTLQHNKFENIFGFGDAVGFETTRTMSAAMAQNPIVKNNMLRYIEGKDVNAVYDGFSYQPLLLGINYATCFQHLHDYEPAAKNHWVPHYGVFSNRYFNYMMKAELTSSVAYTSFKKDHGPPYQKFAAEYDELENNEYLKARNVTPEEVRHPAAQARMDAGVVHATD